ncbi:MAG: hypothetical protein ACPIOQ_70670 [Promethearchaeia archaeon]
MRSGGCLLLVSPPKPVKARGDVGSLVKKTRERKENLMAQATVGALVI